jgi:glycosyltransferase involved in cell wall biosynthesis
VALLAAKVSPFTISNTIHGSGEFENPEAFHLQAKIEASRFVIAVSNYSRSQLMRYSPCSEWHKFEVCRLGVELSRYTPAAAERSGGPFWVISVGSLSPVKGIPVLIEAIGRLVATGRDVRARIVGDGPLQGTLKDMIRKHGLEERIRMEGALNHESVIPLYRLSHALILPSFAEGLPVVLMEAMAAGLPCVATCITGVPELIEDGVEGLLVPASDVDALTQAMARLMDNEELRQRLGEAARRKVEREYDAARNGGALAQIFFKRLSPRADCLASGSRNGVVR